MNIALLLKEETIPTCCICGTEVPYAKQRRGENRFCSRKHLKQYYNKVHREKYNNNGNGDERAKAEPSYYVDTSPPTSCPIKSQVSSCLECNTEDCLLRKRL